MFRSRTLVFAYAAAAFLIAPAASAVPCHSTDPIVSIDHQTGAVSPAGPLQVADGEHFCIEIQNTDPECLVVNLTAVPAPAIRTLSDLGVPATTYQMRVRHTGATGSYEVALTKKAGDDCKTAPGPVTRTIPVETLGWRVDLAGAFTADGLVDPVFFLESATRPKPTAPTETESGFLVRDRTAAEDDQELGAAVFLHLYRSTAKPAIHWVPLSFGLGIAEGSRAKYYLGTGVRFSDRAFLTAGVALGPERRLPDGLGLDDFTTDANSLKSLPERTTESWFASLSFRGLGVDLSRFTGAFKATPKP